MIKLDAERKLLYLETKSPLLDDFGDIIFPEELNDENIPLFVADVNNFREYMDDALVSSKYDFVDYEK